MKKLLGLLLVFGLSIHAEDQLSYTLKNNAKEPITFTLRFRAKHVGRKDKTTRGILMTLWEKTVQPGQQKGIRHGQLEEMSLTVQDQKGEIIIDNIKPEQNGIFTILPDYTLRISR